MSAAPPASAPAARPPDGNMMRALIVHEGVPTSREGALPARLIALGLLAGLLIGGLLGAAAGSQHAASYSATTVASILPDDALTAAQAGAASTQNTSDFIQGELIVLTSRDLLATVGQRLGMSSLPSVTASQSGTTDVVDITATAGSQAQAERVADTTRTVYAQRRATQLGADVTRAQAQVGKQIAQVRAESLTTPGGTNGTSALSQEYARLLSVSSQLDLDAAQAPQSVGVIQAASPVAGGLPAAGTYGLGGGVLGVLVAAVGLVLLRRTRPRVRTLGDLAGLGASVVVPEFPRDGSRRTARLLVGRLAPAVGSTPGPALVLIGAGGRDGVDHVAAGMSGALAAHAPVLLIPGPGAAAALVARLAPDAEVLPVGPSKTGRVRIDSFAREQSRDGASRIRVLDIDASGPVLEAEPLLAAAERAGWSVVVVAPPLQDSAMGARFARVTGRATVVVSRGVTPPVEVIGTLESLEAAGIDQLTVLLAVLPRRRPVGRRDQRPGRRVPSKSTAPAHRAPRTTQVAARPAPAADAPGRQPDALAATRQGAGARGVRAGTERPALGHSTDGYRDRGITRGVNGNGSPRPRPRPDEPAPAGDHGEQDGQPGEHVLTRLRGGGA